MRKEKKPKVIAVLTVVVISITLLAGCIEEQNNGNRCTAFFTNISPTDAQNLINNNLNLTIVDCRNDKYSYEKEWIPNATWNTVPEHFYDATNDLLVYSQEGTTSIEFCEQLVNYIYGTVYNLEGGINAWKNAGYTTEMAYATFFTNISAEDAHELINSSANLTIADCRGGCKCKWNEKIPGAQWMPSPQPLHNHKNDILIYSLEGEKSIDFCEKLVNHTYGAIYRLEGGIDAWKNAGYETEKK